MQTSRRRFLKHTLAAGAAGVVPSLWTSTARGDTLPQLKVAAIGVGGSRGAYSQGRAIGLRAAQFGRMVAVCDVDAVHAAEFAANFEHPIAKYNDYRDLLERERPDVVTIGTPDHWHVPIAIAALRAGCDVYCEKPLTLTIEEGIRIRKVVEETGRVMQVGTQQRSEHGLLFLQAVALVRSGRLGNNVRAHVAIDSGPVGGPFETTSPPADLDWDRWVGPAPATEYSHERRKEFRWYYDYSGGKMTDWGAHHVDIAQWALGVDHTGPTRIRSEGKYPPIVPEDFDWQRYLAGEATLPNAFNTPMEFHVDLTFAERTTIGVHNSYQSEDGQTKFTNGILFEGDEGRLFVNRGRLSGKVIDDLTEADKQELQDQIVKLYRGKEPGDHMRDFFDCIASRETPISDVATHHRTMTSCHLCNIALMLGRELEWDPREETFPADDQARALLTRPQRDGFV